MSEIDLVVVDDEEAITSKAAQMFRDARPRVVALAGGETPRKTYEALARDPGEVTDAEIFLTDERCVPIDHIASNFRMINEALASRLGAVHPVDTALTPEQAARDYEESLKPYMPLDLAILGIGVDGHTASLFPGMDQDQASGSDGRLVTRSWSPETGLWRVSLTYAALDSAKQAIFIVSGERKRVALKRVLRGDDIPASKIRATGSLTIIADLEAASGT
ncbi:MAG: 6-phosphogluconolactonase [Actinomycetota bacterium]